LTTHSNYINNLDGVTVSKNVTPSSFDQDRISTNELQYCKEGKAANSEFLTNEHMIYGGNKLDHIYILFNQILQSTCASGMLKVGKVISIYNYSKNKNINVTLQIIKALHLPLP
jgi:hypothetical protein